MKSPTFKYEIRCIEPLEEHLYVISTLTHQDEVTFCIDDLAEDNLNGFYVSNSDYIYLDSNNPYYEKTIVHEYSHYLMDKRMESAKIEELEHEMYLNNEELTDITAFFILLDRGQELIDINQFSYFSPHDLLKLDNDNFFKYINKIYAVEGIEEDPDELFDKWITETNEKNNV